jgi:transcriptional regulator with XRE-family HTH domain
MLRNKYVSPKDLVRELKARVAKSSQSKIAIEIGVKAPMISNVLSKRILPTGKLLKWLGYERVVVYRKRK